MMLKVYEDKDFFDRSLSWLKLNCRVLAEAESDSNPLLEKLMFLAIVSSNLDQFVMVKMAGLKLQKGYKTKDKGRS